MLTWWFNKVLGIQSPSQMYNDVMAESLAHMYRVMDESWGHGDGNTQDAKTANTS
jgi:hypothetical protein